MFEVAVIGSGYGGAVLAARLAPHARTVVIERGAWWRPGQFPESVWGLARTYASRRNPAGLWAMRLGQGTGNAFASAVGGSSVINYGISEVPEASALAPWPVDLATLAPYFSRAQAMLGATPNPRARALGDRAFFDRVAPGRRHDLANAIDWTRCSDCGRCVPGCNTGAKRSLDVTYLGSAFASGAELRSETTVQTLTPIEGGYRLELQPTAGGPRSALEARRVVLAAGTFGTIDLLHRSRGALPLSASFGRGLGMNGDGLAFLYDLPDRLDSDSGAPISTSVRLPFTAPDGSTRTLMVMSGRVPKAAMRFTAAALAMGAELLRDREVPRGRLHLLRRAVDLVGPLSRGALSRTLMYKLDGQDEAKGVIRHTAAGAVIDWADCLEDPLHVFARQTLAEWAHKTGGTAIANVATLPGMRSFGVHALGGCRLGRTVEDGVVDEHGRVFDPRTGAVYPGLRIADGSLFPGSTGVPPSLTIAALSERIAEHLVCELERERTAGVDHRAA